MPLHTGGIVCISLLSYTENLYMGQSLSHLSDDSSLYTREPLDISSHLYSTRMNVHFRTRFHLIRVHFVHPPSPQGEGI